MNLVCHVSCFPALNTSIYTSSMSTWSWSMAKSTPHYSTFRVMTTALVERTSGKSLIVPSTTQSSSSSKHVSSIQVPLVEQTSGPPSAPPSTGTTTSTTKTSLPTFRTMNSPTVQGKATGPLATPSRSPFAQPQPSDGPSRQRTVGQTSIRPTSANSDIGEILASIIAGGRATSRLTDATLEQSKPAQVTTKTFVITNGETSTHRSDESSGIATSVPSSGSSPSAGQDIPNVGLSPKAAVTDRPISRLSKSSKAILPIHGGKSGIPAATPVMIAGLPFVPASSSLFIAPNGQEIGQGNTVYIGSNTVNPTPLVLTTDSAGSSIFVVGTVDVDSSGNDSDDNSASQRKGQTTIAIPSQSVGLGEIIIAGMGGTFDTGTFPTASGSVSVLSIGGTLPHAVGTVWSSISGIDGTGIVTATTDPVSKATTGVSPGARNGSITDSTSKPDYMQESSSNANITRTGLVALLLFVGGLTTALIL